MIEAQIHCKTRDVRISDLGLILTRGAVLVVPLGRANKSADLHLAQKAGAVEVRYVERCREQRDAEIPQPKRKILAPPPPPVAIPVAGPVPSSVVPNIIVPIEAFRTLIREELATFRGGLVATGSYAVAPSGRGGSVQVPQEEESTPMFIPSHLVGTAKGDIQVQRTEGPGEGIEDAAKALTDARRKRKGK